MSQTQGLNIQKCEHTLALEEFERRDFAYKVQMALTSSAWKGKPLIILQKIQDAILYTIRVSDLLLYLKTMSFCTLGDNGSDVTSKGPGGAMMPRRLM